LLICLVALVWPTTVLASSFDLYGGEVAWSRLVFRAVDRADDLSVEITLAEADAAELAAVLRSEPGNAPAPAPDGTVLRMTSTIDVFLTGRSYRTDIWFQSAGVSPLQRHRDKMGQDANRKVFRYLADGVRRLRIEPAGRSEAKLAPEKWTGVKERFYPFGAARTECPVLSDPNLLFLIASAGALRDASSMTLCVFNKKTIHTVRLSAKPGGTLAANYLEVSGGARNQVRRQAQVRTVRIQASPPQYDGVEPEPFEFFEISGDIKIDLDAENGLPLRMIGEISGFGRVELVLSEADLSP